MPALSSGSEPTRNLDRSMEYNAYYAEVAALVTFLAMGVRLRRKAARSQSPPERFLSAAFLFWALGYMLWDLPYALTDDPWRLSLFGFSGRVAIHLGTISLALFIRSVFRPQEGWAVWLVVGMTLCLVAGVGGSAWIGDWLGDRPFDNVWYWMELAGNIAPSSWMAAEGLIAYANARRRGRLGLCDPISCNRFFLWGLAGVVWLALEIVVLVQEIEFALNGRWSDATDIFSGVCQFVPVALLWIAFFPPASYRNWIARHGGDRETTRAAQNG